jgi:hypothetical protein
MNDLRPFQPKSNSPLSGGARFIRGFTRIGAAVAVLVALIGGSTSVFTAISEYDSKKRTFDSAICVTKLVRQNYSFGTKSYNRAALDYESAGCSEVGIYGKSAKEVVDIALGPEPTFINAGGSWLGWGLIITGALAVLAYLASGSSAGYLLASRETHSQPIVCVAALHPLVDR